MGISLCQTGSRLPQRVCVSCLRNLRGKHISWGALWLKRGKAQRPSKFMQRKSGWPVHGPLKKAYTYLSGIDVLASGSREVRPHAPQRLTPLHMLPKPSIWVKRKLEVPVAATRPSYWGMMRPLSWSYSGSKAPCLRTLAVRFYTGRYLALDCIVDTWLWNTCAGPTRTGPHGA